jgi:hypothetical protein
MSGLPGETLASDETRAYGERWCSRPLPWGSGTLSRMVPRPWAEGA